MNHTTFEFIFECVCQKLKRNLQVEAVSKQFSTLETDDQRYAFVTPFLKDYNFTKSDTDNISHKSEIKSTKLREEGNRLFGKKRDSEALNIYTQSVAYAPLNSQSVTLAFANRSAVLKSLGYYNECILDIQRALQTQYPDNLEYKLYIRKGECHSCLCEKDEALDNFLLAKKKLQKSDLCIEKIRGIEQNLGNLINTCASLNGIVNKPIHEASLPRVSFGENSEILCASDAIELKYSEEMGRHIVAAKDLQPGDVLIVEQPYASILLPEFIYSHCSHCLKRCPALIPCKHCILAMYCSDHCRDKAWIKYHDIECAAMPALLAMDMGKMALLATRIVTVTGCKNLSNLLKTSQNLINDDPESKRTLGFINGKYNSIEFSPIYNLITNTSHRIVPDLFKRSLLAVCILKCLKLDLMPESHLFGGLVLRLLQSLPCNAHEVSELSKSSLDKIAHSIEIGAAAYATLSLLNHSCDPNVVRHSHKTAAVLRAIKSIQKGTQILDNYGYHFAVHEQNTRQTHLKNQYLFNCACEACCNAWPLHVDLPMKPVPSIDISTTLNDALTDAMNGILKEDMLPQFLSHIANLDKVGARLCQEYNCCQEAIKQYFATLGNYYLSPN